MVEKYFGVTCRRSAYSFTLRYLPMGLLSGLLSLSMRVKRWRRFSCGENVCSRKSSASGVRKSYSMKNVQLIAEMDRTQAQNMLAAAQAMMTQAKDAEARMKQLHDNHSLPERRLTSLDYQYFTSLV